MSSTQHTGIVVSAAEADIWHAAIRDIMETRKIPFEQAVSAYIETVAALTVPYTAPDMDVA